MTNNVIAIIIHHQGVDDTQQCLAGLTTLSLVPTHVVVVNNSETKEEDCKKLQESFPEVEQLLLQNQGFAAACNEGINSALYLKPTHIWILNNDIRFICPDALEVALEAVTQQPRIAVGSIKMCFINRPNIIHWAGGQIDLQNWWNFVVGENKIDAEQYSEIKETTWATGANMLIPIEAYHTIGQFDEQFFMYMEDVDWSLRAQHLGYKCLFIGTTKLLHKGGADTSAARNYFIQRARLLFVAKHFPNELGYVFQRFYQHQIHPHFQQKIYHKTLQDIKIVFSALRLMPCKVALQGIKDYFNIILFQ